MGTEMASEEVYTTRQVLQLVPELTYRQLAWWVSTDRIVPSGEKALGSGYHHLWTGSDVRKLRRIARRIAWGMTLDAAMRDTDPPMPNGEP